MKILAWLGYLLAGIIAVVCGNLVWSVLSVKMAEKIYADTSKGKE
jgi:hypothetical protein